MRPSLTFLLKTDRPRDAHGRYAPGGGADAAATASALRYFHGVETGARGVDRAAVPDQHRTRLVAAGLLAPRQGGGHQLTAAGRAAVQAAPSPAPRTPAPSVPREATSRDALTYFHGVESGARGVDRSVVLPEHRDRLVAAGLLEPIPGIPGGHRLTSAGRQVAQGGPLPGPVSRPAPGPPPARPTAVVQGTLQTPHGTISGGNEELRQEAARAFTERLRPEVQELLRARPIGQVNVDADVNSLGLCRPSRVDGVSIIDVNAAKVTALHETRTDRRGIAGWNPRRSGIARPAGVSTYAATVEEKRQLVLVHEVGHAVHNMNIRATRPIMETAYAQAGVERGERRGITEYANTNPYEYFAESFTLYNHSPEKLQTADPTAHQMVRDVLAAARAAVIPGR